MPAGETEKDPSGWTTDTLQVHLQRQIDDLRRMLQERYETQTKAVDAAFVAQQTAMSTALTAAERAVATALLAAEKAVNKAELAANARFEAVNEFRAQLADQAATFMPRTESIQRHEQNAEKVAALEARHSADVGLINSRLDLTAGRGIGIEKGWSLLVGLAGLVGGVIAIIITLAR